MAISLVANNYGKSRVRLVKVMRSVARHEFVELSVNISLEGDLDKVYLEGDNTNVLTTDTMKNTVYALAKSWDGKEIEAFGAMLGSHFLDENPRISRATVEIAQSQWNRIGGHDHSFTRGAEEQRAATVSCARGSVEVESGIENLVVLKTTGSAFAGYKKDRFTTLKETSDRIFATAIGARWKYAAGSLPYTDRWNQARDAILKVFSGRHSASVQQTLYQMGEAVLEAVPEASFVKLTMPNKHCLLVDLAPFGLENPNEIFVPTDEPHGLIEGSVSRT